jgi:hypothetical protein
MVQPNDPFTPATCESDGALLEEFEQLWADAGRIWDEFQETNPFFAYVSADYLPVYKTLQAHQGRYTTFLEWGSGLGVVAIMASRMGFEAYGIEVESVLVDHSEILSTKYKSTATFSVGSFIPNEFEWNPAEGDEVVRTSIDAPDGYDNLDMELRDFELVYAYPWPAEHLMYHNILQQFASPDAIYLRCDAREGVDVLRLCDL